MKNIFLTISIFLAMNLCMQSCKDNQLDQSDNFFSSQIWHDVTKTNLGEKGYTPDLQVLKYPLLSLEGNNGGITDTTQWFVRWQEVDSNSFQHLREGIQIGYRRLWSYACAVYNGAVVQRNQDSSKFDFVINADSQGTLDDWGYHFEDMLTIELETNSGVERYSKVYFYFQDETCSPLGWSRTPYYSLPLMGVHVGCAILYYQDVDITGLEGNANLTVRVNPLRRVREQNYRNNEVMTTVNINFQGVHLLN